VISTPLDTLRYLGSGATLNICCYENKPTMNPLPEPVEGGSLIRTAK